MPLADLDDVTSFFLWIHGSPIWFGPAATWVVSYLFCVHLWKKHKVGNIGPDMGVSFCLKTNRILQKTSPLGNAKETLRFPLGFRFRQALQRNRPVKQRSFSVFKNYQHWYTRSHHRIPFFAIGASQQPKCAKTYNSFRLVEAIVAFKIQTPKVSIRDDDSKYQPSSKRSRHQRRREDPFGVLVDAQTVRCKQIAAAGFVPNPRCHACVAIFNLGSNVNLM